MEAGADESSASHDAPGGDTAKDSASGADANAHRFDGGIVRIMPLGDSITGSTCWRARLWEKLMLNGHTNFAFVGSLNTTGDCSSSYDGHNEGHGGYLVTDLVGSGQHASEPAHWFMSYPADVVLVHFGTNDVWNSKPPGPASAPGTILDAYTGVIAQLRLHSPNVVILVAQIIPMAPDSSTCSPNNCSCASCSMGVVGLNGLIPAWASMNSTPGSPIIVVDQYTGFDVNADTRDKVHPNDSGSVKMANRWYDALTPLF
jgi:hypothetical protein